MSLYSSRSEQLITGLYQQIDELIDLAYSKTLEYYCTIEEAAHRATLSALKRAQHILKRLQKLGVEASRKFVHYQTELERARQYLKERKKYIDLPDHGSLISVDAECEQFRVS